MADSILAFMSAEGYLGVFLLMVLENVFPPIPSEIILPFMGHLVATGDLTFVGAVVVSTIGSMIGTSLWFVLGWMIPVSVLERFFARFGGYVAIDVKDFKLATRFFTKYELPAVFLGRMIPTVRSVISIPAGCVRMSPMTFIVLSAAGTAIWNTILISVGYFFLNDYHIVETYMNPIADIIIVLFLALYLMQVGRFIYRRYAQAHEKETHTIYD